MKKCLILFGVIAFMSVASIPVFAADEETDDSIGAQVRDFLGCPGGNKKCFTGKFDFKGVSFEGTWYLE